MGNRCGKSASAAQAAKERKAASPPSTAEGATLDPDRDTSSSSISTRSTRISPRRAHDLVRPHVLPVLRREAKKYTRLQQAKREADARIAKAEELQKKLLSKQKAIEASLRSKVSRLERMESELARQRTDFKAETEAERIHLAELTARLDRCATECSTRASLLDARESEYEAKLQRQSALGPVRRSLLSEACGPTASDFAATADPMSVTSSHLPEATKQGGRAGYERSKSKLLAISDVANDIVSNLEALEGAQFDLSENPASTPRRKPGAPELVSRKPTLKKKSKKQTKSVGPKRFR